MNAPRSVLGARWALREPDPEAVARAISAGWLPAAARCLALRGFHDDVRWLNPQIDHLHDPMSMASMPEAVARLQRAAERGERLRIITDYDVDGTTSSLILQAVLRVVAPRVHIDYHIPDRFNEGYGFSVAAARRAVDDGVDLIVTADIGVRDHAAVDAARDGGVDVLICDHHLPAGAEVPARAIVLCPPQAACHYQNPALAACGVSVKLAQALLAQHPKRELLLHSLLKLAAIGTVADMVPLDNLENRAIVTLGLRALNAGGHNAGLSALIEHCGLKVGEISEEDLSFRLGPRINAAGRIANATHVVELLTCRDPEQAGVLAGQLEAWNHERRAVQQQLVSAALAAVPAELPAFVLVAGPEHEGWHRGVVGIVASKLKDELHRPVAVVSVQGELAVGSVRSVPGVHAVQALGAASDLLLKFGGHPAAAGFTVRAADLPALRERLASWCATSRGEEVGAPDQLVDAEVSPVDLTDALLHQLHRLRPFGMGNPEPQLWLRAVRLNGLRALGKDRQHLKARLGDSTIEAVWWGGAAHLPSLANGPVDLLGRLSENVWQGRRSLQFVVRDARPA
jgi:single-stranded-DNA-specific exonuclease